MTGDKYADLLARKTVSFESRGLAKIPALSSAMFPHQQAVTEFALRQGCAAQFLDTGLGKTLCALEWARVIVESTNKPVLMLAPLAVSAQHVREAAKFNIDARAVREPSEISGARVYITNYERFERFPAGDFSAVVLDESSIIKSFTGSTTRRLMEGFARTPYRLACTATPAPNDHMELGQHSQFLGVMPSNEMLSRWFIADQTEMGRYRLKRPAIKPFWNWVASWARCVGKPSDLGFSDDGFVLPSLNLNRHVVRGDLTDNSDGEQRMLFRIPETSATSIHREKRSSVVNRAAKVAELVAAEPDEPWIIWCDTNYESDELLRVIPGALEVRGDMSPEMKEERLVAFSTGAARILITKPSIAGFGLNWQHCARVAFIGLSFSYESFYQAVRRCWRFGQKRPVDVHVCMAETEMSMWQVVSRKQDDHTAMKVEMQAAMRRVSGVSKVYNDYEPVRRVELPGWIREWAA
jgi:hypothetical protein